MSVMKGCEGGGGGVVRCGYLKKLKTSRKKFFVLRAETSESSARLEYYDSERKYNSGQQPKRSIPLKNCFNINRRLDTKHKHVIALYTKDDCFCVILDNEEDVDSWLKALLKLQHGGEEVVDGEIPKPTFEHVWQVTVLNRGLGTTGLTGNYRLCLTAKTLSLIKKDCEQPTIQLNLANIRSCGSLRDFFFLEVGRSSTLGAGELWMQTEDNNIAHNVHSTVFHAMSANGNKEELAPRSRNRSSSATESSKPNNMTRKVPGNMPSKYPILPQDISQSTDTQVPAGSSSQHPIVSGVASFYQHLIQRGSSKAAERRHSISAGSVTQPGTISHQRTQSLPLANPAPISDQNTSHPLRVAKRSNQSSKCMGASRERCDSMPSRPHTTSEGSHPMHIWNQARSLLNPHRTPSLHTRDTSHSPPSGGPASPPSAGCSTDSAGSSYSLTDDGDICTELDSNVARYSHSLTPEEPIVEEECVDCPTYTNNYIPMVLHPTDDGGYVDMSPKGRNHNSPTASVSSVTSGTPSTDMKFSDYPLEKVTSYFTSEEDNARPTRAYSVGSKPESYKRYVDMMGRNNENLRERAMSVGSKTKKALGRVLPPHSYHPHQGTKSSSAPILSNSRGQGSHSSIGPMDDLMEMDFSRSESTNNSGYMDMTPGPKSNHGYVEMKPGRKPDTSPYVDMSQGSSPAKPSYISLQPESLGDLCNAYMDMDLAKNSVHNNNNINSDYLTMSFKRPSSTYQLSPAKVSPLVGGYLDSHFGSPKTEPATPDGYVEMSLGRGHQRQSSLDSAQIVNEDYANMSMGKKRERNRKKDKTRSQPIAIQNPGSNAQKCGSSSSSSPRYALLGRKYSTGTPPMHLPLSETTPYSSLPRQRRRDSKDSSSSSVTTTPSNSSTIFPLSLNSPCSPIKLEKALPQLIKKTESDYTPMDFDNKSDYVNFNPKTPVNEDYALMKPGVGVRVNSPPTQTENTSFRPINDNNREEGPLEGVPAEPAYELLRTRILPGSDLNRIQSAAMRLSDTASFRPINENNDSEESRREPAYEILRGRPPSVSDNTRSLLSRPSSTSSELCSSGSTIVGSRPESVNSDRVRPASVSSADVQLHYASLDLEEGNRSPRTVKGGAGEGQGGTEVTLTYAAIDFVKSEGLKHNSLATNAKVKH